VNTLVFANIPHDCHESELQRWIEERGFTVTALRLIRDSVSYSSPAFAHIEMATPSAVLLATQRLNGQELRGKKVLVRSERMFSRFEGAY